MKENRVRVPRVRSPQEDDVRVFYLAIGACPASCSEYRRQTGDAWGMSSSVAAIDVVGPHDATDEFLRRVVQFIGGLRATEHAKVSMVVLRNGFPERRSNTGQGFLPSSGTMRTVLANQRSSQAGFR